jgi:heme o synthase
VITNRLSLRHKAGVFFQLIKVTVTLPVTFLAFIGFCLFRLSFGGEVWLLCTGIFLLAGSASALNQILEKKYDALMPRTKQRPIPSGNIGLKDAWIIVIILGLTGIAILAQFNAIAVLLGFITLFWYAGVYTFLKRKTGFAVIPGALTGALPPLIGWVAAGGKIADPLIVYTALFVFIWQIPHFWLLILIYGEEYRQAGFPTLYDYFNDHQIRIGTFLWIILSVLYAILFLVIRSNLLLSISLLSILILLLVLVYMNLFMERGLKKIKLTFHLVNAFMLLFLLSILIITLV